MKLSDFSEQDLRKIAGSLTPEEKEFANIIDSGFKKMAQDVEQTLNRLRIVPSEYSRSYWPIPRQHAGGAEEGPSLGVLWKQERLNGSMVVAFSKQRERIVELINPAVPDSLLAAILVNIIYTIVGQTNQDGTPTGENSGSSPSGLQGPDRNDAYLFELGCNLLFLLDVWHVSAKHADDRARIFHGQIVSTFLELFQASLRTKNLGLVLVNRFERYYDIAVSANSPIDTLRSLFTELAKRCGKDTVPVAYDFTRDFPVLIGNIMVEYAIGIDWASTITAMTESLCKMFAFAYSR